jgi:hypothetical protein
MPISRDAWLHTSFPRNLLLKLSLDFLVAVYLILACNDHLLCLILLRSQFLSYDAADIDILELKRIFY